MASNADRARQIIEWVSAFKFDEIEALLHEDIVQECPYQAFHSGPMMRGRDAVMQGLQFVPQVFDTFKLNIHALYDCPEQKTVIFEMTSFGVFAMGGGNYQNRYIMVFEFRDDKLVLWREYFNPEVMNRGMAFMAQAT